MRENAIRYFRSLSSGTVASLTGESRYDKIELIISSVISSIENASESALKAIMLDDEHVDWSIVQEVLVRAKKAVCEVL